MVVCMMRQNKKIMSLTPGKTAIHKKTASLLKTTRLVRANYAPSCSEKIIAIFAKVDICYRAPRQHARTPARPHARTPARPERYLVTIAENVDIQHRLAINAKRMEHRCERSESVLARSDGWRVQNIKNVVFPKSDRH